MRGSLSLPYVVFIGIIQKSGFCRLVGKQKVTYLFAKLCTAVYLPKTNHLQYMPFGEAIACLSEGIGFTGTIIKTENGCKRYVGINRWEACHGWMLRIHVHRHRHSLLKKREVWLKNNIFYVKKNLKIDLYYNNISILMVLSHAGVLFLDIKYLKALGAFL